MYVSLYVASECVVSICPIFPQGMEVWEKINITSIKPTPRTESVAVMVSDLIFNSEETKAKIRSRTGLSVDRSSKIFCNKIGPCEKTYIFKPSEINYTDGSDGQYSGTKCDVTHVSNKTKFLQEISRLSQLNMSRRSNKCNYTVLSGSTTDSTESLLAKKESSPLANGEERILEYNSIIKSKSSYTLKNKQKDVSPLLLDDESPNAQQKLSRDPVSVPNFSLITMDPHFTLMNSPSPEENVTVEEFEMETPTQHVVRGTSYNSHLGYMDNSQDVSNSNSMRAMNKSDSTHLSNENISATSDYASIETVNRCSTTSNTKPTVNTLQELPETKKELFGFCNPNYVGLDPKVVTEEKNSLSSLSSSPDSVIEEYHDVKYSEEPMLELQNVNGIISNNTKVLYRHTPRNVVCPNSQENDQKKKHRASSASRAEKRITVVRETIEHHTVKERSAHIPLYMFVVGGKEQSQITVFQRPLSIWRFRL